MTNAAGFASSGGCKRRRKRRAAATIGAVIDQLRVAAEAMSRGDPEPFVALIAEGSEWRGLSSGHLWWKQAPT